MGFLAEGCSRHSQCPVPLEHLGYHPHLCAQFLHAQMTSYPKFLHLSVPERFFWPQEFTRSVGRSKMLES